MNTQTLGFMGVERYKQSGRDAARFVSAYGGTTVLFRNLGCFSKPCPMGIEAASPDHMPSALLYQVHRFFPKA